MVVNIIAAATQASSSKQQLSTAGQPIKVYNRRNKKHKRQKDLQNCSEYGIPLWMQGNVAGEHELLSSLRKLSCRTACKLVQKRHTKTRNAHNIVEPNCYQLSEYRVPHHGWYVGGQSELHIIVETQPFYSSL